MADLEQLSRLAAGSGSLRQFLTDLTLDPPTSTSDLAGPPHLDDDFVTISTIHSAKGCEWDVVHVLHLTDGHIPSDLATGDAEAIEEERRLLYVAMTRAHNHLYGSCRLRYDLRPAGWDDGHGYGELTRFFTPDVLACVDVLYRRVLHPAIPAFRRPPMLHRVLLPSTGWWRPCGINPSNRKRRRLTEPSKERTLASRTKKEGPMRRPTRRVQVIAAVIGVLLLACVAVALAATGKLAGGGDDFEIDSAEPSTGSEPTGDGDKAPPSVVESPVAGGQSDSKSSSAGGSPRPPAPGPDVPVSSSDETPQPKQTIVSDPPSAFGGIRNFDECAAAGYPVMESYPEQCRTPDGRLFVRVVD